MSQEYDDTVRAPHGRAITEQEVFAACDRLAESGTRINNISIRSELGDRGSFSTIGIHKKKWERRHQRLRDAEPVPAKSRELQGNLTQTVALAIEAARAELEIEAHRVAQQQAAEAYEEAYTKLEDAWEELRLERVKAEQELAEQRVALSVEAARVEGLREGAAEIHTQIKEHLASMFESQHAQTTKQIARIEDVQKDNHAGTLKAVGNAVEIHSHTAADLSRLLEAQHQDTKVQLVDIQELQSRMEAQTATAVADINDKARTTVETLAQNLTNFADRMTRLRPARGKAPRPTRPSRGF